MTIQGIIIYSIIPYIMAYVNLKEKKVEKRFIYSFLPIIFGWEIVYFLSLLYLSINHDYTDSQRLTPLFVLVFIYGFVLYCFIHILTSHFIEKYRKSDNKAKKFLIFIIAITSIILLFAILYLKNTMYKDESNLIDRTNNTSENSNIEEKSYINERGELNTSGLYSIDGHTSNSEVDLMQNDMTWNGDCRLYHKIITNIDDYNKYSSRIDIPEMTESDFDRVFMVILSNENLRDDNEKDLMIYDVYADEKTIHIVVKQKENPKLYEDQELLNNVFYAIVDNSQLRENVEVVINSNSVENEHLISNPNEIEEVTDRFLYGTYDKSGKITKIQNNKIYFIDKDNKEYILENTEKNNYINGRTSEKFLFEDIKEDYYINLSFGQKCYIFKNIKGEELKKELLKNLSLSDNPTIIIASIIDIKKIQQLENDEAIVTFSIKDFVSSEYFPDANDENSVVEVQLKFTNDTKYDTNGFNSNVKNVTELENAKNMMIYIRLNENTLNDDYPIVSEFESYSN